MKNVLFVDDEPNVLAGLRRMLRGFRSEWKMDFADGGDAALQRFESTLYDVVVTDMRMPGTDGARLLEKVKDEWPDTVRIILSGQCDEERVFRAIGPAHQFLSKPCDPDILRNTVNRACALREEMDDQDLKSVVSRIEKLPSFPKAYEDLLRELDSDSASVDRVGMIVGSDPAMTAKVLQLVNSSFFGLPHRVASPTQAVSLLGLERIRTLVLSAGIFCQFDESGLPPAKLERLINHSLAVATLAQKIAILENAEKQVIDDAFTAGMLHDLGMLVFLQYLRDDYEAVVHAALEAKVPLWRMEKERLSATHAQVGAYLLSLWGLPGPIVEAVAWHHTPSASIDGTFTPLTAVHAANNLQVDHSPLDPPGTAEEVDIDYLESLGIADRLSVWAPNSVSS